MKTPEQERDHGTADDGQRAEELFTRMQEAQAEFWEAVQELEAETGLEIDSTRDFGDVTLEALRDESEGDEGESEGEGESATCSCDDPSHIHPESF